MLLTEFQILILLNVSHFRIFYARFADSNKKSFPRLNYFDWFFILYWYYTSLYKPMQLSLYSMIELSWATATSRINGWLFNTWRNIVESLFSALRIYISLPLAFGVLSAPQLLPTRSDPSSESLSPLNTSISSDSSSDWLDSELSASSRWRANSFKVGGRKTVHWLTHHRLTHHRICGQHQIVPTRQLFYYFQFVFELTGKQIL